MSTTTAKQVATGEAIRTLTASEIDHVSGGLGEILVTRQVDVAQVQLFPRK